MADLKFLDDLIIGFENLPGVGKKTAKRYAYYVIEKMSDEQVNDFAKKLVDTKSLVHNCPKCGMYTTGEVCEICSLNRDNNQIMVVKDSKDVLNVEQSGVFRGNYHVLGGLITPIHGVGPDKLNIDSLINRINEDTELIIATPFSQDGEITYMYIRNLFKNRCKNITRIGFGLPAGGDLDYVDEITLKRAIENRSQ